MIINTKYKIGDKVFRLERHTERTVVACTVCGDTKQVDIKGTLFQCPACVRGSHCYHERWFYHTESTTIGKVQVEVYLHTKHNCNYFDEDLIQGDGTETKETYMLAATGIGSGTIWNHNKLFLTLDEARAESDKRNDAIISIEGEMPK